MEAFSDSLVFMVGFIAVIFIFGISIYIEVMQRFDKIYILRRKLRRIYNHANIEDLEASFEAQEI